MPSVGRVLGSGHIITHFAWDSAYQTALGQACDYVGCCTRTDRKHAAVHFYPGRKAEHAGVFVGRRQHVSRGAVAADKDQQIDMTCAKGFNSKLRVLCRGLCRWLTSDLRDNAVRGQNLRPHNSTPSAPGQSPEVAAKAGS